MRDAYFPSASVCLCVCPRVIADAMERGCITHDPAVRPPPRAFWSCYAGDTVQGSYQQLSAHIHTLFTSLLTLCAQSRVATDILIVIFPFTIYLQCSLTDFILYYI